MYNKRILSINTQASIIPFVVICLIVICCSNASARFGGIIVKSRQSAHTSIEIKRRKDAEPTTRTSTATKGRKDAEPTIHGNPADHLRTESIDAVLKYSDSRPITVIIAPTREKEFLNIYGTPPTAADIIQERKYAQIFTQGGAINLSNENSGKSSIESIFADSADSLNYAPIIIVGHSESSPEGSLLCLPDGSKVSPAELNLLTKKYSVKYFLISCFSKSVGLSKKKITLKEAYILEQAIRLDFSQSFKNGTPINLTTTSQALHSSPESLILTFITSGTVEGDSYIYMWEIRKKRPLWIWFLISAILLIVVSYLVIILEETSEPKVQHMKLDSISLLVNTALSRHRTFTAIIHIVGAILFVFFIFCIEMDFPGKSGTISTTATIIASLIFTASLLGNLIWIVYPSTNILFKLSRVLIAILVSWPIIIVAVMRRNCPWGVISCLIFLIWLYLSIYLAFLFKNAYILGLMLTMLIIPSYYSAQLIAMLIPNLFIMPFFAIVCSWQSKSIYSTVYENLD